MFNGAVQDRSMRALCVESRQREERESVRVALKRGGEQTAVRRHGDRRDGRVAAARKIQNMGEYAHEVNVRNGQQRKTRREQANRMKENASWAL